MPSACRTLLGDPVQDQHVGGIAHVVVGLDHQDVGIHPGLREMPVGGGEADIGRGDSRQIVTVVVGRLVSRKATMPISTTNRLATAEWCGPADHGGTDPSPKSTRASRLASNSPTRLPRNRTAGPSVIADATTTTFRWRRYTHGAKVRQPAETQTIRCPGDRQARTHDDRSDGTKRGVVGGIPILTGTTRSR